MAVTLRELFRPFAEKRTSTQLQRWRRVVLLQGSRTTADLVRVLTRFQRRLANERVTIAVEPPSCPTVVAPTPSHLVGPVRRVHCLASFFDDGEFYVESYLNDRQTVVPPELIALLASIDGPRPVPDVLAMLAEIATDPVRVLEDLLDQEIIVEQGTTLDAKDRAIRHVWREWGHAASYLHYASQHVMWLEDPGEVQTWLRERADKVQPPAPYAHRGPVTVALDGDSSAGDGIYASLRSRQTVRTFTGDAITREAFSTIMLWTWGATHEASHPTLGEWLYKTSPSGGARHPIEVYPLVLNVDGIERGLYHYDVEHHALTRLPGDVTPALATTLAAGQAGVGESAAVMFMTALVEREMWKYTVPRSYRILHLDAGHLGQTFHLVCTHLGLAPWTFAAQDDRAIEEALALDPAREIPIYTAVVGVGRAPDARTDDVTVRHRPRWQTGRPAR